jgi:phage terminase large subunit-like protein
MTNSSNLPDASGSALTSLRRAVHDELRRREDLKAAQRKILTYFPESGPLRRELYVKHQEFFAAGAEHRERLMLAANRVGKTESVGGYETTMHLTGWYPEWWVGRRFNEPISGWCAGDTGKTVLEILQTKLMGPPGKWGTGLIPGETIARTVRAPGRPDALDAVYVKHKTGGISRLSFKSYEQGRESFQGTEQHLIWLDEEPPMAIYTECLLRTMATAKFVGGLLMLTFTPLRGMSEVVLSYLPGGKVPESGICPATS